MNHTSVFPAASPEKAREVDAAGGVCWGEQNTFPCDCPDLNFRRHDVALTFATHHHCPPPWAPIPARRKRLTRTVR